MIPSKFQSLRILHSFQKGSKGIQGQYSLSNDSQLILEDVKTLLLLIVKKIIINVRK